MNSLKLSYSLKCFNEKYELVFTTIKEKAEQKNCDYEIDLSLWYTTTEMGLSNMYSTISEEINNFK